ncbi:MAG: pyridoxal-phosphate dependent enzyme [Myxococcota bacterium]
MTAVSLNDVLRAYRLISPHIHRTPIQTSSYLAGETGFSVLMKCELFQKTGSFKIRGALNAVMNLDPETAARGVVTHSSGNHAAALALAAKMRGIPAHVVMPVNAAPVKRAAVEHYGAQVYPCAPTQDDRETEAARVQRETGATLLPPFDHPHIIAGQGTIGLELLEQANGIDAVIVPVGGGGMLSGIATAVGALAPGVRIIAAEPADADDTYRSFVSGERQSQPPNQTVADGLRTSVGELTWPIIKQHVERVVTVSEDAIIQNTRAVWERCKLLIEPSAAVGVAAAQTEEVRELGLERVAVILCGGNVDLDRLPWQTALA